MNRLAGALAIAAACAAAGCTDIQLEKFQQASANYQAAVVSVNADIAATAPAVAAACADIQKWAMLIAPFVPNSGKAKQYFGAANGAIEGFCQDIPTNVAGVAASAAAAARQAQAGYNQVAAGG